MRGGTRGHSRTPSRPPEMGPGGPGTPTALMAETLEPESESEDPMLLKGVYRAKSDDDEEEEEGMEGVGNDTFAFRGVKEKPASRKRGREMSVQTDRPIDPTPETHQLSDIREQSIEPLGQADYPAFAPSSRSSSLGPLTNTYNNHSPILLDHPFDHFPDPIPSPSPSPAPSAKSHPSQSQSQSHRSLSRPLHQLAENLSPIPTQHRMPSASPAPSVTKQRRETPQPTQSQPSGPLRSVPSASVGKRVSPLPLVGGSRQHTPSASVSGLRTPAAAGGSESPTTPRAAPRHRDLTAPLKSDNGSDGGSDSEEEEVPMKKRFAGLKRGVTPLRRSRGGEEDRLEVVVVGPHVVESEEEEVEEDARVGEPEEEEAEEEEDAQVLEPEEEQEEEERGEETGGSEEVEQETSQPEPEALTIQQIMASRPPVPPQSSPPTVPQSASKKTLSGHNPTPSRAPHSSPPNPRSTHKPPPTSRSSLPGSGSQGRRDSLAHELARAEFGIPRGAVGGLGEGFWGGGKGKEVVDEVEVEEEEEEGEEEGIQATQDHLPAEESEQEEQEEEEDEGVQATQDPPPVVQESDSEEEEDEEEAVEASYDTSGFDERSLHPAALVQGSDYEEDEEAAEATYDARSLHPAASVQQSDSDSESEEEAHDASYDTSGFDARSLHPAAGGASEVHEVQSDSDSDSDGELEGDILGTQEPLARSGDEAEEEEGVQEEESEDEGERESSPHPANKYAVPEPRYDEKNAAIYDQMGRIDEDDEDDFVGVGGGQVQLVVPEDQQDQEDDEEEEDEEETAEVHHDVEGEASGEQTVHHMFNVREDQEEDEEEEEEEEEPLQQTLVMSNTSLLRPPSSHQRHHTFSRSPVSSSHGPPSSPFPPSEALKIVEITSTDPGAAARAAAILQVHHGFIQRGWRTGEEESLLDTEMERSIRREERSSATPASAVVRSKKGSGESQMTMRTWNPETDAMLESLLIQEAHSLAEHHSRRKSRSVSAARSSASPACYAPSTAGSAVSSSTSKLRYDPDFEAWGKQDWKRLERCLHKSRRECVGEADPVVVAEMMYERWGVDPLDAEGTWEWAQMIRRVKALQIKRPLEALAPAPAQRAPSAGPSRLRDVHHFQDDNDLETAPPSASHRALRPLNEESATYAAPDTSTPRRFAKYLGNLVASRAVKAGPEMCEVSNRGHLGASTFDPPTPSGFIQQSTPAGVRPRQPSTLCPSSEQAPRAPARLDPDRYVMRSHLPAEQSWNRSGNRSSERSDNLTTEVSRRGKRRTGDGQVWVIINQFEDEEDRREEERRRLEEINNSSTSSTSSFKRPSIGDEREESAKRTRNS